jgi:hypothetical protein
MTASSIDENEAVATIARWISRVPDFKNQITTEASRVELTKAIHEALRTGERRLEDAVAAAREGDPFADRALRHIAQELMLGGAELPECLRLFVAETLLTEPPAFPPGQHALNSRNLNRAVKVLVTETVARWGVAPTRNVASEHACACSLVSDALNRFGIEMSEGQVKRSYEATV